MSNPAYPGTAPTGQAARPDTGRSAVQVTEEQGSYSESTRSTGTSGFIEREIADTRARMDAAVDVLAERLRPSNLINEMVAAFTCSPGATAPRGTTASTHSRGFTESYSTDAPESDDEPSVATRISNKAAGMANSAASAAGEKAKEAALSVGEALLDKIKENPLPSAVIGAGLAWMFFGGESRQGHFRGGMTASDYRRRGEPEMYGGSYVDARTGRPYDRADYEAEGRSGSGGEGPGWGGRLKDWAGSTAEGVRDAASSAADKAREWTGRASDAGHRAGDASRGAWSASHDAAAHAGHSMWDAAGDVYDRVYDTAGNAYDRFTDAAGNVYYRSRRNIGDAVTHHPLAMGAAALAAGILAGLVLPKTRPENRYLGDSGQRIRDAATDLAEDAYERGKKAVEAGRDAAMAEAERRGLTPEQLKRDAKDIVEDVRNEASEAGHDLLERGTGAASHIADDVREKGLTPSELAEDVKAIAKAGFEAAKEEAVDESEKLTDDAKRIGEQTKRDLKNDASNKADQAKNEAKFKAQQAKDKLR